MTTSPTEIRLNRPQADVLSMLGPQRTIALPWGRGVGKTFFLSLLIWLLVHRFDGERCHPKSPRTGVRILFVMDTLKHFRDLYAQELREQNAGRWAFLGGKLNRS